MDLAAQVTAPAGCYCTFLLQALGYLSFSILLVILHYKSEAGSFYVTLSILLAASYFLHQKCFTLVTGWYDNEQLFVSSGMPLGSFSMLYFKVVFPLWVQNLGFSSSLLDIETKLSSVISLCTLVVPLKEFSLYSRWIHLLTSGLCRKVI